MTTDEDVKYKTFTYNPDHFNPGNIIEARRIVLTPEDDLTTDDRWELETPYLIKLMEENYTFTKDTLVLDYGTGLGRLAKELIKKYDLKVIGVDIAPNMRALGTYTVYSDNFISVHPNMLEHLNIQADYAISVWVLQHCFVPKDDIRRIYHAMKPNAQLFVANNKLRAIPTVEGLYVDDGIDISIMLNDYFTRNHVGVLDQKIVSNLMSRVTFYGTWQKNKAFDRSEEEIFNLSDADKPHDQILPS